MSQKSDIHSQLLEFFTANPGLEFTVEEITAALGYPSITSVSACIRDLRKPRYGGHSVAARWIQPDKGVRAFVYCYQVH